MQWHAILGPGDGSGVKWAGQDPPIGEMDIKTLDALCEVLASHTADPDQCLFGLCEIQGWLDSISTTHVPSLLELPMGRNYAILTGPLSAIDQLIRDWGNSLELTFSSGTVETPPHQDAAPLRQREAPNLIWPSDHSWFVASEVDFDSTLIGGSATLIDAVLKCPALEAMPIEESTSLAADADTVNGSALPEA